MNADEKRGYSKGYSAGRLRLVREGESEKREAMREDFIQRMMLAIAPQIIRCPWGRTVGGEWKAHTGAVEIMGCVRNIAVEAAAQCRFIVPREPEHGQ